GNRREHQSSKSVHDSQPNHRTQPASRSLSHVARYRVACESLQFPKLPTLRYGRKQSLTARAKVGAVGGDLYGIVVAGDGNSLDPTILPIPFGTSGKIRMVKKDVSNGWPR